MQWLLAVSIAVLPLIIGEALYKAKFTRRESSRKIIHMLGALSVIILIAILSLNQIAILSGGFIVVLFIARKVRLVHALYEIERKSYGEILFPAGVCLSAIFAQSIYAFIFGILVLGFADAIASLVGTKYSYKKYKSLVGHGEKSIAGSLTFFVVSFVIGICVLHYHFHVITAYQVTQMLITSLLLTTVESQLSFGLDNFIIPVISVAIMQIIS